jgi:glycosyltransferase involved in cell wall biosynthesis
MRGARGCIMPSRREGFCGSVLEAGALGLGLICTDVLSFREIVRHGVNGLIVSSEDPDSLADAIADFARNPALACRLGEALRTIVRARFSVEQMAEGYLDLYREVLSSVREPAVDGAAENYQRGHPPNISGDRTRLHPNQRS